MRDRTLIAQTAMVPVIAALRALGRAPVLVETFAGGEKDFAGLAQRLKASAVTHIALAAFPSEAALLLADVRKTNPDVAIYATDQLAGSEFARIAGPAADGLEVAMAPDATAFPRARHLIDVLVAKGLAPSRAALASFAAIEVILAATKQSSTDPERVTVALQTTTFDTILGPVRFNATGAANLPSHVFYKWTGGTLSAVKKTD